MRGYMNVEEAIAALVKTQAADIVRMRAMPEADPVIVQMQDDLFRLVFLPYIRWQIEQYNAEADENTTLHAGIAVVARITQAMTQIFADDIAVGRTTVIGCAGYVFSEAMRLVAGTYADLPDREDVVTVRGTMTTVDPIRGGNA